jgi:probable non-F420 flavinoid oxidoreductase
MVRCSYHASHEQFSPSDLLTWAVQAEAAGFDGVFCSDHLQPWAPSQGHAGHAWVWLGAALQATRQLSFSTITVPGGWRYHPVPLAQAIGTLAQMFPGRMPWIAFGSGEAINERLAGAGWPPKAERNERLLEGVQVLRALLAGERVRHGGHLQVDDARLWERPASPPLLFGAALGEETARWLGGWADGLLTVGRDLVRLERLIAAFRDGGGDGKPVHVKVDVAWAGSDEEALHEAHRHWRFNGLGGDANAELRQPEDFEEAARSLRPEDMHAHVLATSDMGRLAAHLQACRALGVEWVDVHAVSGSQAAFIDAFARDVLSILHA